MADPNDSFDFDFDASPGDVPDPDAVADATDPGPESAGPEDSLDAHLLALIDEHTVGEDRYGASQEDVVAAAADARGIEETEVRHALEFLVRDGEVYKPRDGRIRVTPP